MNAILTASHYGVVRFGDLECGAVVLTTGERGYVRGQLASVFGFHETHKGSRFRQIAADFAPNALEELEKKGWQRIRLPSGQKGQFFPAGIIPEIAAGVIDAALAGTLNPMRRGIVPNCLKILSALATVGEVALQAEQERLLLEHKVEELRPDRR